MDGDHLMSGTPAAAGRTHFPELQGSLIAEFERFKIEEGLPTHLDNRRCGYHCNLSEDKLSVHYNGFGRHGMDVGAVQANLPIPLERLLYYFEVTVENRGRGGRISLGFTGENFHLGRHLGWEPNSFGYHGDDGRLYRGDGGRGDPLGPTFSTGDTVGAGINFAIKEIFFTKNGGLVGRAALDRKTEGPLYPTIGLHSPNEKVGVNFGQRPFEFDDVVLEDWVLVQPPVERLPLHVSSVAQGLQPETSIVNQLLPEQDGYLLSGLVTLLHHIAFRQIVFLT